MRGKAARVGLLNMGILVLDRVIPANPPEAATPSYGGTDLEVVCQDVAI